MLVVLATLSASLTYSCPANFSYSMFVNLTSPNGGAIYISSSTCTIGITNCLFYNDSAATNAGAVYFYGSSANFSRTCFIGCCAYSYWSAYYCTCPSITLYELEISVCCNPTGYCTTEAGASYINLTLLNVTSNFCHIDCSGIYTRISASCLGSMISVINNTDVLYGATIGINRGANPYKFSNSNFVGSRPAATYGFISIDESATSVVFFNCFFNDNGNYSYVTLGSSGSNSYPTFSNCFFDIPASRLSGSTLVSCSFGVIGGTGIYFPLLNHRECFDNFSTAEFTFQHKSYSFSLLEAGMSIFALE